MHKDAKVEARDQYYGGISLSTWTMSLGNQVKVKHWAQAIIAATLEMINDQQQVGLELLSINEGAYMVMGNGIFKLDLVEHIVTGTRALPALRKQVLDKSRQDATKIVEKAEADGQQVTACYNRKRAEIQSSIDILKAQLESLRSQVQMVIPQWALANSIPLKLKHRAPFVDNCYSVGMMVPFQVKWLTWTAYVVEERVEHRRIAAAPAPPFNVMVWIDLVPSITTYNIGCDLAFSRLPHMGPDRSCHILPNVPPTINNYNDYTRYHDDLQRIFEEINFDSPLGGADAWYKPVHSFIPPLLKPMIDSWGRGELIPSAYLNNPANQGVLAGHFEVVPPIGAVFTPHSYIYPEPPPAIENVAVTEEPIARAEIPSDPSPAIDPELDEVQ
jgi:hypothetical protein